MIYYLKRSLLLFSLCALVFHTYAQPLNQTIRGRVVDKESQMPLWGANVAVLGTSPLLGASSDEEGYFRIEKVPVGRHTLRISFLGYEEATIPELLVGSGKEVVLQIALTESIVMTEGVTIEAKADKSQPLNEMSAVSARMFTVEETKRYAASINDPGRMAQSFAGVASGNDLSNEIVIRGNNPSGLLWRLEGIEIPNPNHFTNTGSSGGGVSILSANMLANSDFFTGAFPAEYGNALSGVFDIKLRNGNNEKREYAFQAGLLGVDFAAEGPFSTKSNSSYLVNYRYSTLAMLNLIGIDIVGDAVPNFQDLSFKIKIPTKKAGSFSIWGLGGLSGQKESTIEEESEYHSDMGAIGLSHIGFLNKSTYIETTLSGSLSRDRYIEEQFSRPTFPRIDYQNNYITRAVRASSYINKKFNARHTLKAGAILSLPSFNLFSEGEDEGEVKRYIDSSGRSLLAQSYVQWKFRPTEKLTLLSGAHYTYFKTNGQSALEPRLGLKYQVSAKQSINFGYGMHSRLYHLTTYYAQRFVGDRFYQINKNLDLVRSQQLVLGYDHQINANWRFKVETYYQAIDRVPIAPSNFTDPEDLIRSGLNYQGGFTTDSLVSEGTGRNYGIELTLEKFFSNHFYFMTNVSLFESKYKGRNGIEYNTRFNNNYVLNALGGKEFELGRNGKNNLLGFNLRMVWMGGNRYTPVNLEESIRQQEAVLYYDRAFEAQVKDYFRLDVRISYRKNKPKHSTIISLDIQNATNRLNLYSMYFDTDTLSIEEVTQTGLIPILNYRIEF